MYRNDSTHSSKYICMQLHKEVDSYKQKRMKIHMWWYTYTHTILHVYGI